MTSMQRRVTAPLKLTVVSSSPVSPGKFHSLTPLDHSMAHHTLHMIFYYANNPGGVLDLGHLRVSLSRVLSEYPGVTGRLTRNGDGNWEVKCNDTGLRVLTAKVGVTVDEWLRSAGEDEERDLTVWEDMPEEPYTWSPFRVQINDFVGGGLALSLSCTHMNADQTSAILFMKAWAQTHLGEPIDHPPVLDPARLLIRPVSFTDTKSSNYYSTMSKSTKTRPTKMSSATFRFSHEMIEKSLSKIHENCTKASPFDFLAALFWTRITDGTQALSLCVDVKEKLCPPRPCGYFGNSQHFSRISLKENELDVGQVALLIHCHLSTIDADEIFSVSDWVESRKGEEGKFGAPFGMYGNELTCISMEHLVKDEVSLIYEVMLQRDDKPVHVSCHIGNVGGEGLIMVMPSPEKGFGRTVTVTLPETQIEKLCRDEVIMELKPTILLRG